jgi:meiotically up-regulated gene 157 (Mug157) protein
MWLRDSANQLQSYLPVLTANSSTDSLASLYRGVINLQSRYILEYPYCQAFQPPTESGLPPSVNGAANNDNVFPPYSAQKVFECKYELDSLAAFLEVSTNYYTATKDVDFFGKYQWLDTVRAILNETKAMQIGTYSNIGQVNISPYSFSRLTTNSEDTLDNNGAGNPIKGGTGLVRSAFRPSDDATIYQGFIPANMMFSRYLQSASEIASGLGQTTLANEMQSFASSIRQAITQWGISALTSPVLNVGQNNVYAFEVDGYGSRNIMDDANVPSLLSAPFFGYLDMNDPVYQATRKILLSENDPYYMEGPVITGIGSVHNGPGYVWPMAVIMRILTSDDDDEITSNLKQLVSSTDGLGK